MGALSAWRSIALSYALLCATAVIDHATGYEYGFSLFYLLPILLTGWRASSTWAFILAASSTATWVIVDRIHGKHYASAFAVHWNAGVRLGVFGLTALLVTRLRRETDAARTDPLTGLPNRRAFVEAAAKELARARRYRRAFTVLYLDADGFKRINDTLGHRAGNQVLSSAARGLSAALRDTDLAARIGGDEFAVLLPETEAAEAAVVVDRARLSMRDALRNAGFELSFSIGATSFAGELPASVDTLLSEADHAMYEIKRARKQLRHDRSSDPPIAF